jgi:hypothetical protein
VAGAVLGREGSFASVFAGGDAVAEAVPSPAALDESATPTGRSRSAARIAGALCGRPTRALLEVALGEGALVSVATELDGERGAGSDVAGAGGRESSLSARTRGAEARANGSGWISGAGRVNRQISAPAKAMAAKTA